MGARGKDSQPVRVTVYFHCPLAQNLWPRCSFLKMSAVHHHNHQCHRNIIDNISLDPMQTNQPRQLGQQCVGLPSSGLWAQFPSQGHQQRREGKHCSHIAHAMDAMP